jgi:hypothetical protein
MVLKFDIWDRAGHYNNLAKINFVASGAIVIFIC